ncbi:MAG: ComEC/Rec2 family competence protein [Bacteroidales bacterium]|nr:ComEC/Rec2 family competence protein [Bacteroidales bacterium]
MLLKFFRKNPFSRLFFFYAAGLVFACHCEVSGWIMVALSAIAVGVTLSAIFTLKVYKHLYRNWIFGFLISFVLFVTGLTHNELENLAESKVKTLVSGEGVFLSRIIEIPEIKSKSVQIQVRIAGEIEHHRLKKNVFRAILYLERDSLSEIMMPGEQVCIRTRFERIPAPGNPGEFDYRRYLANRRIFVQSYIAAGNWYRTTEKPSKDIRTLAESFRGRLLDRYRKLQLNPNEFNVLSALTLGYRHELDAQTKNAFSKAGVMHVMALSGFHTGLIAMLLGYLFGLLNGSTGGRIIRSILIVLTLWGFAIITGLSASVSRATFMLSLVITGSCLGEKVNTYNILFATAFFMLILTPGLAGDVSFQLTFLAVAGIVLFYPVLYRTVRWKNRLTDKVWKLLAISCAAQLATFPLTLYYFHQFPLLFWLANLFAVPLVAVIIYLAAAYLLLSFIDPLSRITGQLLVYAVKCLLHGVSFMEAVPNALMDNLFLSAGQAILLLLCVFCFGIFLSARIKTLLFAGFLLLSVVLLFGIRHDCRQSHQKLAIINNLNNTSSVNLISGHKNLLIADPDSLITPANIRYSLRNYWIARGVSEQVRILDFNDPLLTDSLDFPGLTIRQNFLQDHVFLDFFGTSMVFLKSDVNSIPVSENRFDVDLVVVTGNLYPDVGKVLNSFDFERLIIDSSVKYHHAEKWKSACSEYRVDCWDINEQGAYTIVPQ